MKSLRHENSNATSLLIRQVDSFYLKGGEPNPTVFRVRSTLGSLVSYPGEGAEVLAIAAARARKCCWRRKGDKGPEDRLCKADKVANLE